MIQQHRNERSVAARDLGSLTRKPSEPKPKGRICATCSTILSQWNTQKLCGPCRYQDQRTAKPPPARKRRCRYCRASYETANSRRVLCPPCYERHIGAS